MSLILSSAKLTLDKSMFVPFLYMIVPVMASASIQSLNWKTFKTVKRIISREEAYVEKHEENFLPLPLNIQIKNLLLLSKILGGPHVSQNFQISIISSFSRFSLFQLDRSKYKTLENDFYQTLRLSNGWYYRPNKCEEETLEFFGWLSTTSPNMTSVPGKRRLHGE